MKPWFIAAALIVCSATAAFAGGIHARIAGPAADGVTYRVRMVSFDANEKLEPWATAEGVMDGKPNTVLLRVQPTSEPGVYEFTRRWPQDGRWVVRLFVGHPGAPLTVATLSADGRVLKNKLIKQTDDFSLVQRMLHRKVPRGGDC